MAYKQVKKYGYRDSLDKGDPEKVIYGADFDGEFEAIQKAFEAIDPDADGGVEINEIEGLQDALDNKSDKDHTHDEYLTDAPNDGKQYVRESEAWAEVTIPEAGISEPTSDGKPYSRQVEGGQTAGAWVEAPTTDDIEYLDGRIDAIEGNISGGGGFVEAPNDGDDYARNGKSPAWVKTYNADYIDALEADYKNADAGKADKIHNHAISDVTGLQTALDGKADAGHDHDGDYAPLDHTHTTDEITGLDDKITGIEGDITDLEGAVGQLTGQLAMGGSYSASTGLVVTANLSGFTEGQPLPDHSTVSNTFVIVVEAGDNPEELGEGDWLVAGQSGWVAIKYGTAGSVDWDNITNVPDFDLVYAPIDHTHEIADVDGLQDALDSSVHIGDTPPSNPAEGQLWQSSASGDEGLYCWDGSVWFEVAGANGADGADGADGNIQDGADDGSQDGIIATWDSADDQWQPNDAVTVDATGNVGIGEGSPDKALVVRGASQQIARFSTPSAVRGYITFSDGNTTDENSQGIGVVGNDVKIWAGNSEAVTIAASGNVGIGTSNISGLSGKPTLHVNDDNGNGAIRVGDDINGSNVFIDHTNADGARIRANSCDLSIGVGGAGDLKFFTDNSKDRLTIDANGDATFSGNAFFGNAAAVYGQFDNDMVLGTSNCTAVMPITNGQADVGGTNNRFKDAHFSGAVNATNVTAVNIYRTLANSCGIQFDVTAVVPTNSSGSRQAALVDFGSTTYKWKDAYFSGSVTSTRMLADNLIQDGAPVVDAKGLINTLSTLRNATKDETTLEGLRDALADAIGGLIENLEHEIATMPAPEPEVSTMEEAE